MSNDTETNEQNNDLPVPSELESLKARAAQMGIKHHPSISLENLRKKVNAAISGEAPSDADEPEAKSEAPATKAAAPETEGQKRKRLRDEALKLVRIRLTCMNPMKKEWEGEILTVANGVVGTVKKYIPFNNDEGWHVPHIMYEQLKERQCQVFVTEKAKNGVAVRKGKMIREFAIEVLDPLTPAELKELAQRQAMARGQG